MAKKLDLLTNASATGNAARWGGGRGTFMVEGTFGTNTVTLQFKGPNGTWIDVDSTNAAFTAAGAVNFEICECDLRAEVAGGAGSSGLYAIAVDME